MHMQKLCLHRHLEGSPLLHRGLVQLHEGGGRDLGQKTGVAQRVQNRERQKGMPQRVQSGTRAEAVMTLNNTPICK